MSEQERIRNESVMQAVPYRNMLTALAARQVPLLLTGFGGSYAYGTNVEGSDTDIRGIYANPIDELIGTRPDSEQYQDNVNDITVYSLRKALKLLAGCNPNAIEILGLRETEYLEVSNAGRLLLENADAFLSKRCIYTFGNYAKSQLNRLMNKCGRAKEEAPKNELRTLQKIEKRVSEKYLGGQNRITFHEENGSPALMFLPLQPQPENTPAGQMRGISVNDFCRLASEIRSIHRDYTESSRNNHAVEHGKLAKHAMHLIRLYMMGIDILERGEIITYRAKEHDLLMSIRKGEMMQDDGVTPNAAFEEVLEYYTRRFEEAAANTKLPESADLARINQLAMEINRRFL